MARVLVTGGTGRLGSLLVPRLRERGHDVTVLSRHPGADRIVGDLTTGDGVAEAVAGVQVVVHAATSPKLKSVDVAGTARLTAAAREARVGHFVYVSIVGVDRNPFRYYAGKLSAERNVAAAGLAYTLARGTQFHSLVAAMVRRMRLGPLVVAPSGWRLQPNDPAEFAEHLAERVDAGPAGGVTEFGGPESGTVAEFAAQWHGLHGHPGRVRQLPVPGRVSAALRAGAQVAGPDAERGTVAFRDWVASH